MPKRIRRERGFKLSPGTIYVGRPTKWGNPHKIEREIVRQLGEREARRHAVTWHLRDILDGHGQVTIQEIRDELMGRDLACWCPLDQPCHADTYLDIANCSEALFHELCAIAERRARRHG